MQTPAAPVSSPLPAFELTPYAAPPLVAALLAVAVGTAIWRRRESPGSRALLALTVGAGWWSLLYGLEVSSPTLSGVLVFGRLAYLGIVVVPPAWLAFALTYTGHGSRLNRGRLVALAVPSVAMVWLAWTTPSTGLVWQQYALVSVGGELTVLSVEYGPLFWVWTLYAYVLTAAGTALLLRSVASARLFKAQRAVLLFGVGAPWVGNLAFVSGLSMLDLTPIGFVLSAVVLSGGFRRYHLLDLLPTTGRVARAQFVEQLPEVVVAIDDQGRIVDLNPSAERLFETTLNEAVGTDLAALAPDLAALVTELADSGTTVGDYVISEPRRYFEVQATSLDDTLPAGTLLALRDVTDRRRREQEMAVLNRVLRHDLRNDVVVIENYAELLRRSPGKEEYVSGIAARAREMRELVEMVRSVEQHLDADEPALSTLNIVRVVRERTDALMRAHPDVAVDRQLPDELWVRAVELIGSAVDNLVENAVEHNDSEEPRVRVSVSTNSVDGDRFVDVVVADNGPPLSAANQSVLVGSPSSLDSASGLGLWLVNWITTESGGRVLYEPNEPRGNVVTLRLRTPDYDDGTDDTIAPDLTTHRSRVGHRPPAATSAGGPS